MKKFLSAVLLMGMLLTFSGCIKEPAEDAHSKAILTSEYLRVGSFDGVAAFFSHKIEHIINAEKLKEGYDSITSVLGDFKGKVTSEEKPMGKYTACVVTEERENGYLYLHLVFNKHLKIESINLDCAPYEELTDNEFLKEEEVAIGTDSPLPIPGILTVPKNLKDSAPAVLIIGGSGPTDKNGTIFLNTPLKDIALSLGKEGIISLRYDKRYKAYPDIAMEKDFIPTLEEEYLQDIEKALDFLESQEITDKENIFVLGHSQGAGLTPYIAASHEEVKGIISVSGSLRPMFELTYDQNKEIEQELLDGTDKKSAKKKILKQMEPVERDILILRGDDENIPDDKYILGLPGNYQKDVKKYSGLNYIDEVKIPVLVLQGGKDFQVFPQTDYPLWQEKLKGNAKAQFKLYPDLNHIMTESEGLREINEYRLKRSVSQEVTTDIAEFIKSNK